jgi:hypothetical protein
VVGQVRIVRAALRSRSCSSPGAERLGESNQPPSDRVERPCNSRSAVAASTSGSANDAEVDDERRCVPCCGGAGLTGINPRG